MLATRPSSQNTHAAHHAFLPAAPSPLSPRSANVVYGRRPVSYPSPIDSMSTSNSKAPNTGFYLATCENASALPPTTTDAKQHAPVAVAGVPFSRRQVKKVPSPKQDELKERRRAAFLRKVRDGREDKRFEARGEDIMRLEFMRHQRAWEAEIARDAPVITPDSIEREWELELEQKQSEMSSTRTMQPSAGRSSQMKLGPNALYPEEEAEAYLRQEREEMEALMSYVPTEGDDPQMEQPAWSDDEDYDALFSELVMDGEWEGLGDDAGIQREEAQDVMLQDGGGEDMDMS